MIDLAVLFLYHCTNDATLQNLEFVKRNNPNVPIFCLGYTCRDLPNTILVAETGKWAMGDANYVKFEADSKPSAGWYQTDMPAYQFFELKVCEAKRYFLMEWDTLVNCSIQERFADVWDADVGTATIVRPYMPWCWWHDLKHYPPHLHSSALGVKPVAGAVLLSNRCLSMLANSPRLVGMSEMRIGTLANYHKLDIRKCDDLAKTVTCDPARFDNQRTVYHSIKTLV